MEYYLTIKRNVIMIHATIWVNCEKIMLSKRIQSQSDIVYDSIYDISRRVHL